MLTIKTFKANSVAQALAQVKKTLGPDAVILHTRTYKAGGIMGIGARSITEITATKDLPNTPRRTARRPTQPSVVPLDKPAPDSPIRIDHPAFAKPQPQQTVAPAPMPEPKPAPSPIAQRVEIPQHSADLSEDVRALKQMVGHVLQSTRASHLPTMPDAIFQHYLKLISAEVADDIAGQIIASAQADLAAADLSDTAAVRECIQSHLASHLPVAQDLLEPKATKDNRPLTVALIGPTGVGKTTTLAKLAATYKLKHSKRVALITCDTYRIAAVEQLRTYANIIGLPVRVALSPNDMATAIESLADHDVILIDTAGRSQRDTQRLDELAALLIAAKPHQTHLVLSSAASQRVLEQAAERFAHLKPDHLIFTKIDEAVSFGVLVNVARKVNASLSFLTTGQEVPDHIEPSCASRIAQLVLDGAAQ